MEKDTINNELYETARGAHGSLERRLAMLLKKSFLSENEEIEMKILKKKKLFYKDMMEELKDER
jgi:hypothetical protein